MKLCHYAREGRPRIGCVEGESIYDVTDGAEKLQLDELSHYGSIDELIAGGGLIPLGKHSTKLKRSVKPLPLQGVRLMSPILFPEKILCVAVNYASHGEEQKTRPPSEPYFFCKFRNALVGPNEPIIKPRVSDQVDWEVELSVVIGKKGKYVAKSKAMDYVAGYAVSNDVSFRDLQFWPGWPKTYNTLGQNWIKGKALDGSFPFGPWIITSDEIQDPSSLELSLRVNGELKQSSNTSEMVSKVADLIESASSGITLKPGDIISTGTPSGVAAFTDQEYLKDGDMVEASISRIGTLRNPVAEED